MDTEHKKFKGTNVIKRNLMPQNYKDGLFNDKIISKSQKRFKSDCHNVHTGQINKIAVTMIRNNKHLIKLQRIHTEQTLLKYAKVRC